MKDQITQQRCPKDDVLGKLINVKVLNHPIFDDPFSIQFRWICPKCHDTFETSVPYLQVEHIGE